MLISLLQLDLPAMYLFAILIAYLVVLLFSISVHEFAHGFMAYRNGDLTAKYAGRLTLNPFKHFNAYGFVCLVVLGFGWADPVPVNPLYFNRGKRSMFQVAVSGIVSNLVLAIFFALIYSALATFAYEFLMGSTFWSLLIYFLVMYGVQINLSLAVFNLLPFYPLDGSKILELILKPNNKILQFLQRYSLLIMIALIFFGVISFIIEIASSFLGTGMIVMWSWLFNIFV